MLRKLKLYGELAEFVGHKEFDIKVDSLGKAVSFLINNFPQIEKYMSPQYYQVKVGNYAVNEGEIHHPIGQEDIHIVPVISGAGSNTTRIIAGVVLIGIAVATGGTSLMFGAGGFSAVAGSSIGFSVVAGNIGALLLLSGVSGMLFPVPKPKEFNSEADPRISFSFSGTQNTSRAGTPVPIVYGEIVTGSVVISGAVDTQQVQK